MGKRGQKASEPDPGNASETGEKPANDRVFISWSGDVSRSVAEALNHWLPEVIEGLETWISTHDIGAGVRWGSEIDRQLQRSNFGIVCLTPDNLQAPWILFEAGALAKAVDVSRVVPYLFRVSGSDVKPALGQFNHVTADRAGTYTLLRGVNAQYGEKYDDARLERKFDKYWPDLEKTLAAIPRETGRAVHRKDRELIEEILETVRRGGRSEDDFRELSNHIHRMMVHFESPSYTSIFNTGFDLMDYIGLLRIETAKEMGDGLLYAYWPSLKEAIERNEGAVDDDVIRETGYYRDVEREVSAEIAKRVMAKLEHPTDRKFYM